MKKIFRFSTVFFFFNTSNSLSVVEGWLPTQYKVLVLDIGISQVEVRFM